MAPFIYLFVIKALNIYKNGLFEEDEQTVCTWPNLELSDITPMIPIESFLDWVNGLAVIG